MKVIIAHIIEHLREGNTPLATALIEHYIKHYPDKIADILQFWVDNYNKDPMKDYGNGV